MDEEKEKEEARFEYTIWLRNFMHTNQISVENLQDAYEAAWLERAKRAEMVDQKEEIKKFMRFHEMKERAEKAEAELKWEKERRRSVESDLRERQFLYYETSEAVKQLEERAEKAEASLKELQEAVEKHKEIQERWAKDWDKELYQALSHLRGKEE